MFLLLGLVLGNWILHYVVFLINSWEKILKCLCALIRTCTTLPYLDQILVISVWDDKLMGFTRAEQAAQWEQEIDTIKSSNKSYESTETNLYY